MAEIFEIQEFQNDLQDVFDDLIYEADTRPGEGPEVAILFFSAAQKVQMAINLLDDAIKIMNKIRKEERQEFEKIQKMREIQKIKVKERELKRKENE